MSDSIKLLLVEDDPLLVRLYQEALQGTGYEVETAFNGEEGLRKLSEMKRKPLVIVSDVMMPKMNGLDMLAKIKADPNLKNIPVVLLTNLGGEEDAKRGLEAGAVTYLVKSKYTPKEVVGKIKEIISAYNRDDSVPDVKTVVKDIDS